MIYKESYIVMVDYNIANIQSNFKKFYDENLQYRYEKLEPIRKECLKKFWMRILFYIVFLASTYFVLNLSYIHIIEKIKSSKGTDECFVLINILFILFCYLPIITYKDKTKSLVMDKILSFWGNLKYKKNQISLSLLKKSELFAFFDDAETDDSFYGKYKDTDINVSEINLLNKGRKSSVTIFKGIIILLDFNKNFKGKTIVRGKKNIFNRNFLRLFLLCLILSIFFLIFLVTQGKEYFWINIVIIINICLCYFIGYLLQKMPKNKDKQNIQLEEIYFNRNWQVSSDDQIEARYILTPILMERINNIKKLFKGKSVDFSFFDNSLIIAIHTNKDMFETTSLFKPALEYDKVKEVVYQLYSIFSVIDTLK